MPDRFDPLMDLGRTKVKGPFDAPALPGDVNRTLAEFFGGDQNTASNVQPSESPSPGAGTGSATGLPAGVDRFRGDTP